jgi:CBS domain-containing protein
MSIRDIMNPRVLMIAADARLKDAARRMDEHNVGILPVFDGERLAGIITDRDIVIRSVAAGQHPNVALVRDSMTAPVIHCFEDQSAKEIARIMEENGIRRLPVLNRDGRLVGLVSVDDLATKGRAQGLAGEVLRRVTEVTRPAA